jgi:nicotinamide riboside transporter PnuC
VKILMRSFSYVFHFLLALFLLLVAGLAVLAGPGSLRLEMLPWSGATLAWVLLFGSIAGLAAVVLAVRGKARSLFFVWSLLVSVILVKGYIFSSYKFSGNFGMAVGLIVLSLVALAGAWFGWRSRPQNRRLY